MRSRSFCFVHGEGRRHIDSVAVFLGPLFEVLLGPLFEVPALMVSSIEGSAVTTQKLQLFQEAAAGWCEQHPVEDTQVGS